MKAVKIRLAGQECFLAYTGEAMFALRDKFGEATELTNAYMESTREGMEAAADIAAVLAEQGELARRALGYDKAAIVTAEQIKSTITPADIFNLKTAITNAIVTGFGREVENEGDVDLGLIELQAQKKNALTLAHFIRMGTMSGLSKTETLLSTPGEVYDLWELYLEANGVRQRTEIE